MELLKNKVPTESEMTPLKMTLLINLAKLHRKQLLIGLINELYTGSLDSEHGYINQ